MKITLGGNAQSSQGQSSQLGVGIHDVKFVSLTNEKIEKKDGSATFDVLKLKFEGIKDSAGKTFEHTVFEPRPGDDVRKQNSFGGENPSSTEELGHLLFHLIAAVAPAQFEAIQKKGEIAFNTWEEIKAFMVKVTSKSAGVETQIKLVPNKENRGVFPSFVLGVSKDKDADGNHPTYPRTNFIGKGLTYTAKEVQLIESKASARPTNMSNVEAAINATPSTSIDDELDLDLDLV